jgi:hypothetical protein
MNVFLVFAMLCNVNIQADLQQSVAPRLVLHVDKRNEFFARIKIVSKSKLPSRSLLLLFKTDFYQVKHTERIVPVHEIITINIWLELLSPSDHLLVLNQKVSVIP